MIGRRQIAWFLFGFFASSLVVAAGMPAHAQMAIDTAVRPPPQRQAEPVRRPPAPAPASDDDDDAGTPRTVPRRAADDLTNGDGEPGDGDDPTRPRRPAADGEPASQTEPSDTSDVMTEPAEPQIAPDGTDSSPSDGRPKADVDAFDRPPAGYDAVAFQIDDLAPILDRRPTRLARFEPYDPIGIRRGGWIIFPELELGANRTSNVFKDPTQRSALFFDVRPTLRAVTNWRLHAVEVSGTGLASFYDGFATENDRAYAFETRTRLDLAKRTNLEMLASTKLEQDSRSNPDAPATAKERADIHTNRFATSFNHRFNRLTVQLRGAYTDISYGTAESNAGAPITNAERNNVQREAAVRATWEFKPTLFAFTEIARNDRTYQVASADGSKRDSTGDRVRVGLGFGNSSKIWRGEVSAGWGSQRPDDQRLAAIDGIILDANIAYRVNELTSLQFTAATDFTDSTSNAGSPGALNRKLGLEARHAFQRSLIGTASLKRSVSDFRGVDLTETETTGELGLEYFLSRGMTVFGRYTHTSFASTAPANDYTVDVVRLGMKIRQ